MDAPVSPVPGAEWSGSMLRRTIRSSAMTLHTPWIDRAAAIFANAILVSAVPVVALAFLIQSL